MPNMSLKKNPMPVQAPDVRNHNFEEVALGYMKEQAIDEANRCLNCNLCVQNCPMQIIKKADGDYPAVHIDYTDGFCDYDCRKCSEICPSGAIKRLTLAEKQKTQIGLAVINENTCIKCCLLYTSTFSATPLWPAFWPSN